MSTDAYTSLSPPWVHIVAPATPLDLAVMETERRGGLVRELQGVAMRDVESLMRQYVREFEFPEYFGWNWDAFDECMQDLDWLPAKSYLTVITNSEWILTDATAHLPTFLRLLRSTGQYWARSFARGPEWNGGEVPFNSILVCDPAETMRLELAVDPD